jgi:hypothetical protein
MTPHDQYIADRTALQAQLHRASLTLRAVMTGTGQFRRILLGWNRRVNELQQLVMSQFKYQALALRRRRETSYAVLTVRCFPV